MRGACCIHCPAEAYRRLVGRIHNRFGVGKVVAGVVVIVAGALWRRVVGWDGGLSGCQYDVGIQLGAACHVILK
jgi:hypothetical protein